jgi:uncharacterized protein (TIGR02996 family)
MPDNHPLLRTILENPADDGARLVYADWLRENGDEARADFIQLQIELDQVRRAADGAGELSRVAKALFNLAYDQQLEREHELFQDHGRRWGAELPIWDLLNARAPRGTWCAPALPWRRVWRRGFMETIRISLAAFQHNYHRLFDCLPLADVLITDKYPGLAIASGHALPGYYEWDLAPPSQPRPVYDRALPQEIFDLLDGYNKKTSYAMSRWYLTEHQANEALSRALVKWGRREWLKTG